MKISNDDYAVAFPKKDDSDFYQKIGLNWKGLNKNEDCHAFWMYKRFQSRRNKIKKFTAYNLYLVVCLKRPWENDWKISVNEKVIGEVSIILNKFLDNYSELPDPQTLRKHTKKENFKDLISSIPFEPFLSRLSEVIQTIQRPLFPKSIAKKLMITFRLQEKLERERYIKKRDLLRAFQRHAEQVKFLLKNWEEEGAIEEKKFSGGSTWIILKN